MYINDFWATKYVKMFSSSTDSQCISIPWRSSMILIWDLKVLEIQSFYSPQPFFFPDVRKEMYWRLIQGWKKDRQMISTGCESKPGKAPNPSKTPLSYTTTIYHYNRWQNEDSKTKNVTKSRKANKDKWQEPRDSWMMVAAGGEKLSAQVYLWVSATVAAT